MVQTRDICPLCGSGKFRIFRQGTIDISHLNSSDFKITDSRYGSLWTFCQCNECSFVFSNPYLTPSEIDEYYTNLEDKEYSMEAEGRSKNFRLILKRLNKLGMERTTLLDVGAASGIFVKLSRESGFSAQGIEPSSDLVKEAGKEFGIKLFQGTVADFKSEKKFSVITLLDVIEHLPDPLGLMEQISRLIEKNGILVIVTPDINSLARKMAGRRWWHYRTAHVNFFNIHSLKMLLKQYGFNIVLRKRYTWNFSLYYIMSRLFPGLKQDNTLQKLLKLINLKLQFFDSWEIYAKKN